MGWSPFTVLLSVLGVWVAIALVIAWAWWRFMRPIRDWEDEFVARWRRDNSNPPPH
jgi:hypothetical protein